MAENNEVVYEAVETAEIVADEAQGITGKDLLKGGAVIGGTIVVWELGKGLVKAGYNKFIKPTKVGEFVTNKKAEFATKAAERKAAKAAAKQAKDLAE